MRSGDCCAQNINAEIAKNTAQIIYIMQRDSKGRFVKGNTEGISTEVAREYQLRSAEARKRNKTLREAMIEALHEDGGNGLTKLEVLVRKAMANHANGKLSFLDLKFLASIMGEDKLNIETNGPQVIIVSQQAVEAAKKWSK